ncbi:MAG: orotate phosphoribosyltransferase [Candidatus Aenigmarchaeota archaeon]|nr:orotate phosphoribosyltransferase [Candidatus Aenigmarchaeota archaeon]
MEREIAEILLGIKAVKVRPDPPFEWASGMLAPIYTDNRLVMSYPAERRTIVKSLSSVIMNMGLKPDVIAGVATSGIPWAAWVAAELEKPLIYVREESKDHGLKNRIEGKLERGQRVVVIEDLVSTGGSSISVVEAIREAGGVVDHCVAIFYYEFRSAAENFARAGCRLVPLTRFSTLIQVATEMGYMDRKSKEKVISWSKDPGNWGRA